MTFAWLCRPFGWLYGNVLRRAATHHDVRIRVCKCFPASPSLPSLARGRDPGRGGGARQRTRFRKAAECISVIMFVGKCTNCGISCAGDLCGVCDHNRQCRRCQRRLPSYLFQAGDVLCRACRNIKPENIGRYALGGLVQEAVWTGEPTDMVVDDFVRRHTNDIVSTINAAIAKHMYVVSCVNSYQH